MIKAASGATAEGLARFLTAYPRPLAHAGELTSSIESLVEFLAAAAPLLARSKVPVAPVQDGPVNLSYVLDVLREPLGKLRDQGTFADPWALAGLRRREVPNAAVLAGLWSTGRGGKAASNFFESFIARLRMRPGGIDLPSATQLSAGYLVRTEDHPMGEVGDRVDITIEGADYFLGIEVKIDAGLQPDQLGRYREAVRRRAHDRGKRPAVVFLSSRSTGQVGIIQADWSDVVAAAQAAKPAISASRNITHHLIEKFAAHVARF